MRIELATDFNYVRAFVREMQLVYKKKLTRAIKFSVVYKTLHSVANDVKITKPKQSNRSLLHGATRDQPHASTVLRCCCPRWYPR